MRKKAICFFVLYLLCNHLYSYSFENLYEDLVNFWLPDRRITYLGLTQYMQLESSRMATYNATDFFINGEGFFVTFDEISNKTYLTRNGRFLFNNGWFLINDDGYFVLGYDGEHIHITRFVEAGGPEYFRSADDFFLLALPVIWRL